MPRHRHRDPIFRYRRYEDNLVVICARWYMSYRSSLRDLVEMMAERGLDLYPSTIWRSVQRFVPDFEKRWDTLTWSRRRAAPTSVPECQLENNSFV